MYKLITLSILLAYATVLHAQVPEFKYNGEFATQGAPLAIACDANGNVYYTVFTFDGPNLTRAYYVEDSNTLPEADSHILISDAPESEVPAGRGFTGIAVDHFGSVYLALEAGTPNAASVRKLTPAPEFAEDQSFGIIFSGVRYNGIDIINEELIVLSTFNTVEFWDADNSAPLHTISGFEAYQRDVTFNPNTEEIYIAKNGGGSTNSVHRLINGSSDDIFSYELENGYIAQGGVNTQFGTNAQLIEYDAHNDLILIPDYSNEQAAIAFYSPADPSIPVFRLDGSESPNGPLQTPADSVAYTDLAGDTWVFITDNASNRILVYSTAESTIIKSWSLY